MRLADVLLLCHTTLASFLLPEISVAEQQTNCQYTCSLIRRRDVVTHALVASDYVA